MIKIVAAIIYMQAHSFYPTVLHVKHNQTITWTNESNQRHNVVIDGKTSPWIEPGQSYKYKLVKPGTYKYYCVPHRAMGMAGTIIVD